MSGHEHHEGHDHSEHVEAVDPATHGGESVGHGHIHGEPGMDWEWGEFWSLMGSMEHWAFELVSDFVVWVVFSLVLYRYGYKKFLEPRLRDRIHREIDAEHGIDHDDCEGKVNAEDAPVASNSASTP